MARDHEPRAALDGGPDGSAVARRVVAGAPDWLAPGGVLLVETADPEAVAAAMGRVGLAADVLADGPSGGRVVRGRSPRDGP